MAAAGVPTGQVPGDPGSSVPDLGPAEAACLICTVQTSAPNRGNFPLSPKGMTLTLCALLFQRQHWPRVPPGAPRLLPDSLDGPRPELPWLGTRVPLGSGQRLPHPGSCSRSRVDTAALPSSAVATAAVDITRGGLGSQSQRRQKAPGPGIRN